jgi:Hypothetical glycosyl hydrolase family 15
VPLVNAPPHVYLSTIRRLTTRWWPGPIAKWLGALILAVLLIAVLTRIFSTKPKVGQGTVHFVGTANSSFDQYTLHQDPSYGAFLRKHMWRLLVYSPYFDDKTRWYPTGWAYDDAYAIYRDSRLATQHPEWILRDAAGSPLYIPFACSEGTCTQYAGDISNPAFRSHWIADARMRLRHGYRGLFIDDVNMEFRVGNGQEQQVAPIDPATHQSMTYDAWRSYMAQFMEQIRTALPHAEIVHNAIWYADSPARTADPYIRREIAAANYINLERSVNDPNLTGGTGQTSLSSFLSYIDVVHHLGRGVILDSGATERQATEYSLASYFLISNGNDGISAGGMTPTHWWTGFDVNLGDANGPQKQWNGLRRRDFNRGVVLVNGPGSVSQTVKLPKRMRDLDGRIVETVSLAPTNGVVLTNL